MNIGIEAISYTGVTVLSMILGSHEKCHSVGHCYVFFRPFSKLPGNLKILKRDNVCSACSLLDKDCSLNKLKNGNFGSVKAYGIIRTLEILEDNESIIIDSSSETPWFALSKPDEIVWVFRDPVGLASSYIKHNPNRKKAIDYMCKAYNSKYKNAKPPIIEYKNIIKDTPQLRGLFERLGLKFDPKYLEYWNFSNHMVKGNTGVLINIAKHDSPEKLDEIINRASNGNNEYKKYYKCHTKTENFSGAVHLLTSEEKERVLSMCYQTYQRMKGLE